ncbi:putative GATA transcription factor 22 [Hirschfeldia incana]|nr:putative GATA transcription factor 22 [Hirschfeldia incana]
MLLPDLSKYLFLHLFCSLSTMGSNFHHTIDLNEDHQNHQPFFSSFGSSNYQNHDHQLHIYHHQAPSNPTFTSSSLTSPSLSYLPFLINSHQDQVDVGYNNHTFHGFLDPYISQPTETNKCVYDGGSSSSDQIMPEKETRLKLTIRKKDNHHDQYDVPQYPTKGETETNSLKWMTSKVRLMKTKSWITATDNHKRHVKSDQSLNDSNLEEDHLKKISKNQFNTIVNGGKNSVTRICFDCNTTKTPLWRSGPRGPKSLCNACGIRQRKARRAAMVASAATRTSDLSPPLLEKKIQNKNKRTNKVCNLSSPLASKVKKYKSMTTSVDEAVLMMEGATTGNSKTEGKSTMSSSSTSSFTNKFYFDDLAIILRQSSAYQQVFPQDEKEAAILLMALSHGMVHG